MRVRGLDLNVQVRGEGRSFIWAHGLLSSIEAENALGWFHWDRLARCFRLIRYDARGHGASEASTAAQDYVWRNLGTDMLAVADATATREFIAAGSSMGCATAIFAAVRAPERVQGMVLFIPPTVGETRHAQAMYYRRLAVLGAIVGSRFLARLSRRHRDQLKPTWLARAQPDILDGYERGSAPVSRRTFWHLLRGAADSELPAPEAMAALSTMPTLILAWDDDPAHPLSSAKFLHGMLPKSELVVFGNHEEFQTLPRRIAEFVESLSGSSGI